MMKVEVKVILLNLLIISNLFEGVYWESIGLLILLGFILQGISSSYSRVKQWKWIVLFVALWIIYAIIQTTILGLNGTQVLRLYGITKTMCMPCMICLCFYNKETRNGMLNSILPIIFIVCVLGLLEFGFGIEVLSYRGLNYIGAVLVVMYPYVVRELPEEFKFRKRLYFLFLAVITVTSGSRAILLCLGVAMIYMFLTESNKRKKKYYSLAIMCIGVILMFLIINFGFNYNYDESRTGSDISSNIARTLSIFTSEGRSDQARTDLRTRAMLQFGGFTNIQRWIGSADNRVNIGMVPVHNCFYEVLLCYGIIGEVLFVLFLIMQAVIVTKNSFDKKYAMIIMIVIMLFGVVQPFITTGTLFQIVVGMLLINSMNKREDYYDYTGYV